MTISTDALKKDLQAMRNDMPSTLAWSGQTVSVTASPITRTNDVSAEGVLSVRELEAVAVLADFAGSVPPDVQAVVQLDGVKYHITEREVDAVGVRMMLRRI